MELMHKLDNSSSRLRYIVDKRNFLICKACYWCASCLTDNENEYIFVCPLCSLHEIESMPISNYEYCRLDYDYIKGMILEFGLK